MCWSVFILEAPVKEHRFAVLHAGPFLAVVIFFCSASSQAQSGASIFKSKCAECHGADGGADTAMGRSLKMRDLRSPDVQKRTDADLTDIITNGMATMPPFKKQLTKDQIQQLIAYLREIAKK